MKTLGLDLGSNSLGWAVLSDDCIEDQGVVLFDEGITRVNGKDTLETPASIRRKYRMARRMRFRRKLRKFHVLSLLIENGMCPLSKQELVNMRKTGIFPDNPLYREWLKSVPSSLPSCSNPYYARAMAATQKVDPMLLGRAIYHLAQRRGFQSSRKDQGSEEEQSEKAKELGKVKNGIAELTAELEKREWTLGQYFFFLNQTNKKIRGHYTGRKEHFEKEFARIAEVQNMSESLRKSLHNALFSQRPLRSQSHLVGMCPLEKKRTRCLLGHPLFEIYRMEAFLNTIRLDEGKGMRFLTAEEKSKLHPLFYVKARSFDFSKIKKALYPGKKETCDVKFNYPPEKEVLSCSVTHQLELLFGMQFDLWKTERERDGKSVQYDYQTVFNALTFFDNDDLLRQFGIKTLGFTEEQANMLVKMRIPEGYAQYSLCAIRRILPLLKEGFALSEATLLAKLPDVMGSSVFEDKKQTLLDDFRQLVRDYRNDRAEGSPSVKLLSLTERFRGYLEDTCRLTPNQINSLYWKTSAYSAVDEKGQKRTMLPPVDLGMLRNPMVQRSMTILRRLVNDLRREKKIDEDTHIHVELARSVNDRNTRLAWEMWQAKQAEKRKKAVEALLQYDKNPKDDLIDKYILREEQGEKCLYTGHNIGIEELCSKTSSFDIEHTVPRSRSGDNSQANKTLCDFSYNRKTKKGRLPSECPDYESTILPNIRMWIEKRDDLKAEYYKQLKIANSISIPDKKAEARQKALATRFEYLYWSKKVGYFTMTAEHLGENFMTRQLNDTGTMTRHAIEFLRSVYPHTYPVNGIATSWARKTWGLQSIYEKKERTDHTHHAIDAMIIAALDRTRFQQICALYRDDGTQVFNTPEWKAAWAKTEPLPEFANVVRKAVENICIKFLMRHNEFKQTFRNSIYLSHPHKLKDGTILRKVHSAGDTVRGQLHNETFYGMIHENGTGKEIFVVRKYIKDNTDCKNIKEFHTKFIDKIVDKTVASRIAEQVQSYLDKGLTFKDAISQPLWMKEPAEDGTGGVPILKVRCRATDVTEPHRLREHLTPSDKEYKNFYYVKSAGESNFRMALFQKVKKTKAGDIPVWNIVTDNILDSVAGRHKPDFIPLEKRTDLGEFQGFIFPGCSALVYDRTPDELKALSRTELVQRLYRLIKLEKKGRMTLRFHREARDGKNLEKYLGDMGKSKTGDSQICLDKHQELLYISPTTIEKHILFEGIHFKLSMTGEIVFLK